MSSALRWSPRGLGYVRGSDAALGQLRRDYIWLRRLDISAEQPGIFVPYLELDADFGKLPRLWPR
jgi:hypothetical protein